MKRNHRWRGGLFFFILAVALGSPAAGLSGCLRGSSVPSANPAEQASREQAATYARSTARDVYRALRRGDIDTSQSLLASDALVVGPRPQDVYSGRTAAIVAATEALGVGDRQKTRSRSLVAEGAATGKSAWIVDRIEVDKRPYTVVAVLAEVDEIWYVLALHVASSKPRPAKPGLAPLPDEIASGAGTAVDLANVGGASPKAIVDQLSENKNATVLGLGRKDHLRGKRNVLRAWKRKRGLPRPFRFDGDVRASVTPDGGVAWVIGNMKTADGESHRTMFVYERASDQWRLVALQNSGEFR